MTRLAKIVLGCGGASLAAVAIAAATAPGPDPIDWIKGRAPSWAEEFTSPPKASEWDRGLSPWPNTVGNRILLSGEQQVYVDKAFLGRETLSHRDGMVTLSAERMDPETRKRVDTLLVAERVTPPMAAALRKAGWVSATLKGRRSFRYGYVEARMRQSYPAPSAWGAFWMLPAKWGWPPEIDIVEMPGDGIAHQNLHTGPTNLAMGCKPALAAPGDFHTFGMLWTAATITFFVDRKVTCSFATPVDMRQPMYPILGLAVGGWAKPTDASTPDMKLQVDYVRMWKLPEGRERDGRDR